MNERRNDDVTRVVVWWPIGHFPAPVMENVSIRYDLYCELSIRHVSEALDFGFCKRETTNLKSKTAATATH